MPHLPKDDDPKSWVRYFAMESNNRAWELAAQSERSDFELREMLHAAHASAFHWNAIGTDPNKMRATYLVAEVHALLGFGESALALVTEAMTFFEDVEISDWERAYLHVIHSHAAAAVGDAQAHHASYKAAETALDNISDHADRRIVEQTFKQVPRPSR